MTSSYHLEDRGKNVPKLRFKGYNDELITVKLNKLFSKIKEKNSNGNITNVICNSAKLGLIPQREYFDKDIANIDNTLGYYVIKNNDFVYNPRKSKDAPYGPIGIYEYSEIGIVSPLYLVFRKTMDIDTNFFKYYFLSNAWHRYVYLEGDSGARHDRVSIKDNVFFDMPVKIPSLQEQEKIASFLTLIDKKIEKQKELVELLKKYKRGLLSAIFSQKLRFKEFDSYWGYKTLKSITTLIKDGTHGSYKDVNNGIPLLSAKDIESGKVVIPADCRKISIEDYENIYKNYSLNKDDILITIVGTIGRMALVGELKQKFALQRSVGILRVNENNNARFISYVLQSEHVKRQFYSKVNQSAQGGIYLDTLGKIDFYSPSLREQEKIANIMLEMDNIIEKETNLLNLYNDYKKGLLQQMFI